MRHLAPVSLAALATALATPAAAQQSFNAPDPVINSGNVTFDRGVTTPGTEVYTINSQTAVMTFTPSDTATGGGPINFQNANTTARFQNGAGVNGYTVLNRIVPADQSRAVVFNGRVESRINGAAGGNVWFYSPGGIVLAGTALFDVGSLFLTARDPGTTITSTTTFTGGGAPNRPVDIQPGATINATAEGSYVALVAPHIAQNGNVRVNGQMAYVAAEEATLSINQGLFDISVTVGADAPSGVTMYHGGRSGGPASNNSGDPHGVYLVAVPKNTANTMVIVGGGSLGFDIATSASVENGRVVLSAGRNIAAGSIVDSAAPVSPIAANIDISGSVFTSDVFARATTNAYAASTAGTAQFQQDVTLRGGTNAHIGARRAGETLSIGGNAVVQTDGTVAATASGGGQTYAVTGGQALLYTENGGTLAIAGNATANADARAIASTGTAAGGSVVAGTASINNNIGGTITVGGTTTVSAEAFGYQNAVAGVEGATLRSGTATIFAAQGAVTTLTGATTVRAKAGFNSAYGGFGAVTGGTAQILVGGGGRIDLGGDVEVNASAAGGYLGTDTAIGAASTAGTAGIFANTGQITATGALALIAQAVNIAPLGANGDGGDATGGTAQLSTGVNGTLTATGPISLNAQAQAGGNTGGGDGIAGAALGGRASIISRGTMTLGASGGTGTILLLADATGGTKTAGATGAGGAAKGGSVNVRALGGTLTVNANLQLRANGTAGAGGNGDGGLGQGGGARLDADLSDAARLTVNGNVRLDANGYGGAASGRGGNGEGGGFGTGGDQYAFGTYIGAVSGQLSVTGTATLFADGQGGAGGLGGGSGRGGEGYVFAYDGQVRLGGINDASFDGLGGAATFDSARGLGGGTGGTGTGGYFEISTNPVAAATGRVETGAVSATAIGVGGAGAQGLSGQVGGTGGAGNGGGLAAIASASGDALITGTLQYFANGTGGNGGAGGGNAAGGTGGIGLGGQIDLGTVSGTNLPSNTGTATFGQVTANVVGRGGVGGVGTSAAGGAGGSGTGGGVNLLSRGAAVTAGFVNLLAGAVGGNGGGGTTQGNGGNAVAGTAAVLVTKRFERTERGRLTTGILNLNVNANGGVGVRAGTATKGEAVVQVVDGDATVAGLSVSDTGAIQLAPANPSVVLEVANGTLSSTGAIDLRGPGALVVNVRDGGLVTANSLSAQNFTALLRAAPGGSGVIGGTPGTTLGTIRTTAALTRGLDQIFYIDGPVDLAANLEAGNLEVYSLDTLRVGGTITTRGFASVDGRDTTVVGNVVAGDYINFTALDQTGAGNGGNLVTANLTAGTDVGLLAINGAITTGEVRAGNSIDLDGFAGVTAGNLTAALAGYDNATSEDNEFGNVSLDAEGGAIRVGNITGIELFASQGDEEVAGSGREMVLGDVLAEKVSVYGFGNVTTGNIVARDLTANFSPPDGLTTVLGAQGNLTVGNVTGQDTIILAARTGSVTAGTLTTPTSAAIFSAINTAIAGATTGTGQGDALYVTSSSMLDEAPFNQYDTGFEGDDEAVFDRSLLLSASVRTNAGTFTSTGPITTGSLRAASGAIALGQVDASRQVLLLGAGAPAQAAVRGVRLGGNLASPAITVISDAIDIAAGATIGGRATQTLTLSALGTSETDSAATFGGDSATTAYHLSNAEAQRLVANRITLRGPGSTQVPEDVTVGALTLAGSGAATPNLVGENARLEIQASGVAIVTGAVTLTAAAASDTLAVSALQGIAVATDRGGSLAVTNAGALAGNLALTAPVIGVAQESILRQMVANPRYAGRDQALGSASLQRAEGFLQAARIALTASDVIAIQNSGSGGAAAGFSARSLTIATPAAGQGASPVQVAIYGRIQQADGSFVATGAARDLVTFQPGQGASFDAASFVNGCVLNTSCAVAPPPPGDDDEDEPDPVIEEAAAPIATTVAALEQVLSADPVAAAEVPTIRFVRVVDQSGLVVDQIISDPVSGSGNASLWDGEGEVAATPGTTAEGGTK